MKRRILMYLAGALALAAIAAPGCSSSSSGGSSHSYTGPVTGITANGGAVLVRTGTDAHGAIKWALATMGGAAAGAGAGAASGTLLRSVTNEMPGDPCFDEHPHARVARWYVSKLRHGRQGRPYLDCKALGVAKKMSGGRATAQQIVACISVIFRHGEVYENIGELLWKKEDAWVVVTVDGRIATATPGKMTWEECASKL